MLYDANSLYIAKDTADLGVACCNQISNFSFNQYINNNIEINIKFELGFPFSPPIFFSLIDAMTIKTRT